MNFDFQGSQNLHIRVAISCSDVMIQTQYFCQILGKWQNNTTISDFLEDFWPPFFITDFGAYR